MSILSLNSVSKSFGALKVTDNVSFDVAPGQALGIIGPNGAGKSTLFNLITGNIPADGGQIVLNGRDVTRDTPMQRVKAGVGRSFQIPQPFTHLSVYENLMVAAQFGGGHHGAKAGQFCMDILDRTGLADEAESASGGLSLLQRKRLELARAMATSPRLILLDEIAGGLTDAECGALIDTIKGIHAEGTAIIWIEHVLHALTSVVERLMVLNFGQMLMIGEPAEVMEARAVKEIYLGIEV
ncbi:ABC transporter ATP-binding protein [Tropicibacter sp. Alg240-R139]|uniref:ABC transporter ATP-binding protein n=1 Tax=Tropicibacter sp. Alg240-R139 TaxID=2305991 RepID=UPI0013E0DAAC|nr:ABC transporter ATP-binding protein [Tropicibacter sp. Alg240-R139]